MKNRLGRTYIKILIVFLLVLGVLVFLNFDFLYPALVEAVTGKPRIEDFSKVTEIEKRLENDKALMEIYQARLVEIERLEEERLERERLEREKQAEEEKNLKIAYLTFDDGPSRIVTPRILNVLDKYDVKATFFVLGKMVEENPDILKMVYDRGHQIGNHSYSHDYKYLYSSSENFISEIKHTESLIRQVVGDSFDSKIIRFPGGSFEDHKKPMREALMDEGYIFIDWNALNGDSEDGGNKSKDELLQRLKQTTYNKKRAVILMHDIDSKRTTADFLASGIEYLQRQGYVFRVLDEYFNWGW